MSAITSHLYDTVSNLPANAVVTFRDVSWEDYEGLLVQVGEAPGLHISYDKGTLQVMTTSPEHEKYASFIGRLVSTLSLRLRINILFFGSATIKKRKQQKGSEPDGCFYVQNAATIGKRLQIDFEVDPPPDIVIEVDVHHDSRSKLPLYAGLGVPEVWRFDGQALTINLLQQDRYHEAPTSLALPMLTSSILTEFLSRLRNESDLEILVAFDEWLQSLL